MSGQLEMKEELRLLMAENERLRDELRIAIMKLTGTNVENFEKSIPPDALKARSRANLWSFL